MKVSGLKNQQRYLLKKVENLSDELVNVMELLELVSQIVEQDEEKDDDLIDSDDEDDEEEYADDFHKKLSQVFNKIIKEQDKNDYYEYKSKRTIEVDSDSDDDLDVDDEIQLFEN